MSKIKKDATLECGTLLALRPKIPRSHGYLPYGYLWPIGEATILYVVFAPRRVLERV